MLLAEEFAEGALHRLVLFHAAAGRAAPGEGPSLPRPCPAPDPSPLRLPRGPLTGHAPRPAPRPRAPATGAAGAAARLQMRATWTGHKS